MSEYVYVRVKEWARYMLGGLGHLGYGKNILQRMQEGVSGNVGEAPESVELMDSYFRKLQERYSTDHKIIVVIEATQDGSQRDRARRAGMSHQTYRNYLNASVGFLDGCLASE